MLWANMSEWTLETMPTDLHFECTDITTPCITFTELATKCCKKKDTLKKLHKRHTLRTINFNFPKTKKIGDRETKIGGVTLWLAERYIVLFKKSGIQQGVKLNPEIRDYISALYRLEEHIFIEGTKLHPRYQREALQDFRRLEVFLQMDLSLDELFRMESLHWHLNLLRSRILPFLETA